MYAYEGNDHWYGHLFNILFTKTANCEKYSKYFLIHNVTAFGCRLQNLLKI